MSDDADISGLPDILEYKGEFGAELILFLPFMHWLAARGALQARTIRTYRGMRSFYEGLPIGAYEEHDEPRMSVAWFDRPNWLPRRNEENFEGRGASARLVYPDLRSQFRAQIFAPELDEFLKPVLIVHNKYTYEWDLGCVNFISAETLDVLFDRLKEKFSIVYIRHGIKELPKDFVEDGNSNIGKFIDLEVVRSHPEVTLFDDIYDRHVADGGVLDINSFKNALYSRCHHFISVQGGGTHQMTLFRGSLLVVLHRCGAEQRWSYDPGFYTFASNPPPMLATCACEAELIDATALFTHSSVEADRVVLSPEVEALSTRLSPATLIERQGVGPRLAHEQKIAKLLVNLPLGRRTLWQRVRSRLHRRVLTGSFSKN